MLCRNLGTQVFSRPLVNKDQVESWRDSFYRVYKSGQQSMRVAVYGTKHDASLFEELLKTASQFEPLGTIGDTMIDTACLNIPKVWAPPGACCAVLCCAVLCCAVLCCAVLGWAGWCCAV